MNLKNALEAGLEVCLCPSESCERFLESTAFKLKRDEQVAYEFIARKRGMHQQLFWRGSETKIQYAKIIHLDLRFSFKNNQFVIFVAGR